MDLKNSKIAVIGLGYVGLPLAVEFGKKRPTIGFDINRSRVEALKEGGSYSRNNSRGFIGCESSGTHQ
jgi:UDP-N-acetyl-D-glucosamine/UDP-N-acetyl-D-galactosamine dehydrogenase